MRNDFLKTINDIVSELGGFIFFPKDELWYDLGLAFYHNRIFFFDHIDFKIFLVNNNGEVLIRSPVTDKKYVSVTVYTYLLVGCLEREFEDKIFLKSITIKYYLIGELLQIKRSN